MLRYSPQPRKVSLSGMDKAGLTFSEQLPYTMTVPRRIKSVTERAIANPLMSISNTLMKSRQNGMWSKLATNIATIGTNVIRIQDSHLLYRSKWQYMNTAGRPYKICVCVKRLTSASCPMASRISSAKTAGMQARGMKKAVMIKRPRFKYTPQRRTFPDPKACEVRVS